MPGRPKQDGRGVNPGLTDRTYMGILCMLYIHRMFGGERLNINISNASNQPIYEQIYTQIKNAIIAGDLAEGDALPSIRQLAKDLRISVITTKRAYEELERDGYLYTVAAKGCFVAQKNIEMIREEKLKEMEEHMREILRLAPACGMDEKEVLEQFRVLLEEEYRL